MYVVDNKHARRFKLPGSHKPNSDGKWYTPTILVIKRKEKKMENHKPFVPVLQFFVGIFFAVNLANETTWNVCEQNMNISVFERASVNNAHDCILFVCVSIDADVVFLAVFFSPPSAKDKMFAKYFRLFWFGSFGKWTSKSKMK